MKRIIPLSFAVLSSLYGAEIELSPIDVESTKITEVAQKAQTSADVAQALSDNIPSIDMNRRSGIANDVFIRGQKRDNISVSVDGTKVYGACPNRMDPPVSHILANQIESIEVIEGPYDVENYGTLSGGLKIATKKPSQKEEGQINLGFGAWNYKKFGATVQGGSKKVRAIATISQESSDQYHDGNSNTLAQQIVASGAPTGNQYQPQYQDMQAYTKKSAMAKIFVATHEDQELQLSATANRSDNILYANSPMDAVYDDSNIYSLAYNIDNINNIYKNINLQYYYSDVDHPMSTQYRKAALTAANNKTNHMWTKMQGVKLKTTLRVAESKVLLGIDTSKREWRGEYSNNVTGRVMGASIDNATTDNAALFAKIDKNFGALSVSFGARYDHSKVKDENSNHQDNTYNALGANILASYHLNADNKLFVGLGEASRVPDARELYFQKSGNTVGTPNLKQTRNTEADIGYETDNEDFSLKIKAFYSLLKDYIYIKKGATTNAFHNVDATVYGAELSGSYYINDDISLDLGASYKRGTKDNPLAGQTDTDLADMAPLRAKIALNYEYAHNSLASVETQMSQRWSHFDADNGEQELAGWAILNAKIKHALNKGFDLTLGVNNLFNKTYAQSNTYADLTLITSGSNGNVVLLNEPGRYFYTNLDFKF